MSSTNRELHIAIVEYLQRLSKNPGSLDTDSIEVAVQCLAESLSIDVYDNAVKGEFLSNKSTTLEEVFNKGLSGGDDDATANQTGPQSIADLAEEQIAQAEKLKTDANAVLSTNSQRAFELYSQALKLNPFSHIIWNNRAVAAFKLNNYTQCIADAKKSIQLNGNYSKSHYRLGLAYQQQKQLNEALTTFQKAYQIASAQKETSMVTEIEECIVTVKRLQNPPAQRPQAPNGMPDMSALMGMLGGMGGGNGAGGLDLAGMMAGLQNSGIDMNAMMAMMGQNQQPQQYEQFSDDDEEYSGDENDDKQQQQQQTPGGFQLPPGVDMNDPKIQQIMAEIKADPSKAMQYLNDPQIMGMVQQVMGQMGQNQGRRQ